MIPFAILLFPLVEISLAMAVVKSFGFANAFFVWLIGTILGIGLFRTSSMRVSVGIAQAMQQGKAPALAAVDGALIGLAGVLFLVPGYFSDLLGLLLLVSPLRRWIAKRLIRGVVMKRSSSAATGAGFHFESESGVEPGSQSPTGSQVIDVDAVVIEGEKPTSDESR